MHIFKNAVMVAKNATCDIQNSIVEQKQMLALSAQQHVEGLHKSLVSSHEISRAAIDFINNLSQRAIKLMAVLEENHKIRSHQLAAFEKNFKEDAAREEHLAIENISTILRNLMARQTSSVSEASQNIDHLSSQGNKTLLQDVSNMLQVSNDGKIEVNEYIEKAKTHYTEAMFTLTENQALMENCIEECTNKVGRSMQHWNNTEVVINRVNKSSMVKTESFISEKLHVNKLRSEEIASTRESIAAKFDSDARDLKSSFIDSLKVDQEMKKKFASVSKICLDHLTCFEGVHGDKTKNMLNQSESLKKDYQV